MIRLENIYKKIDSKEIFKDFFLEVKSGDLLAIIGKSGSGKTTLLNLIGLIEGKFEGKYTFMGETNIKVNSSKAQKLIRDEISYLFQNFALVENETVFYNLMLALKYVKVSKSEKVRQIKDVLQKVNLEYTFHQKVSELSGGEQQRIAIARAILKPSSLILADEPTGSLDEENRDLILQLLLELHDSGKTVIIVTHDPLVARKCSRVIEL